MNLLRLAAFCALPNRALWALPGVARHRLRRNLNPMHWVRRASPLARNLYTGYRLATDPAGEFKYQGIRALRHAVRHAMRTAT